MMRFKKIQGFPLFSPQMILELTQYQGVHTIGIFLRKPVSTKSRRIGFILLPSHLYETAKIAKIPESGFIIIPTPCHPMHPQGHHNPRLTLDNSSKIRHQGHRKIPTHRPQCLGFCANTLISAKSLFCRSVASSFCRSVAPSLRCSVAPSLLCSVHILLCRSVLDRKLDPTVGPLLRTLVRLCVDPIDPIRDVAIRVLFDFRCDDDADTDADADDDDDDNDDDHDNGNESGGGRHRPLSSSSSTYEIPWVRLCCLTWRGRYIAASTNIRSRT